MNIKLLTTEIYPEEGEAPRDLLTSCVIIIRSNLKSDIDNRAKSWKADRVKIDKIIEAYSDMIAMVKNFIEDTYKDYSKGYCRKIKSKYLTPLQELLARFNIKNDADIDTYCINTSVFLCAVTEASIQFYFLSGRVFKL